MNRPMIIAALAVLSVTSVSSVALADSHGCGRDNDRNRSEQQHDHRQDHRNDRYDRHSHERFRVVRYVPPAGYRHYAWHQGAHLPRTYYAPRYVVHNYSVYRLRPPPRGYHWVRVDNDVVLAAVTTGLVMQVINGIFY